MISKVKSGLRAIRRPAGCNGLFGPDDTHRDRSRPGNCDEILLDEVRPLPVCPHCAVPELVHFIDRQDDLVPVMSRDQFRTT